MFSLWKSRDVCVSLYGIGGSCTYKITFSVSCYNRWIAWLVHTSYRLSGVDCEIKTKIPKAGLLLWLHARNNESVEIGKVAQYLSFCLQKKSSPLACMP